MSPQKNGFVLLMKIFLITVVLHFRSPMPLGFIASTSRHTSMAQSASSSPPLLATSYATICDSKQPLPVLFAINGSTICDLKPSTSMAECTLILSRGSMSTSLVHSLQQPALVVQSALPLPDHAKISFTTCDAKQPTLTPKLTLPFRFRAVTRSSITRNAKRPRMTGRFSLLPNVQV